VNLSGSCTEGLLLLLLPYSFLNTSKSEEPVVTPLPKMMQFVKRLKHLQV
jgi:hypothetical protein